MLTARTYLIFALFILVGLLSFFVVSGGYYPVAMVNGTFIMSRQFKKDYQASAYYYVNVRETYGEEQIEGFPLTAAELQRTVLNQIVDDVLVRQGARGEFKDDFGMLLSRKLEDYENDEELKKAAEALYGLSFSDVKQEILVPQAERDLLSARLFLRGERLEDWLSSMRTKSTVRIFSQDFYWDGNEVKTHDTPKNEE